MLERAGCEPGTILESTARDGNARNSCNWPRKPPSPGKANPESHLRAGSDGGLPGGVGEQGAALPREQARSPSRSDQACRSPQA